jgi:hypothetical protein
MMFASNDRKGKVGIALICPNPCSTESYSDGRTSDEAHRRIVFDHIRERLAGFQLRKGRLSLVVFHSEFDVGWPARSNARGSGGRVLCERRCCEQKKYEESLQSASLESLTHRVLLGLWPRHIISCDIVTDVHSSRPSTGNFKLAF